MTKKNCREEIDKVNKKANKKIADMKNKIQFWKMVANSGSSDHAFR